MPKILVSWFVMPTSTLLTFILPETYIQINLLKFKCETSFCEYVFPVGWLFLPLIGFYFINILHYIEVHFFIYK